MKMQKLFGYAWRPVLAYAAGLVAAGGLFFYRLGSLTPAFARSEVAETFFSRDIHHVWLDPLFWPHTVWGVGLHKLNLVNSFSLRAVSAFIAIAGLYFFYLLLKQWFSFRVTVVGLVLFATSSFFLHHARLAVPSILQFGLVVLAALAVKLKYTRSPKKILMLLLICCGGLMYVPGMIWFIVAGLIWQRKTIGHELRSFGWIAPLVGSIAALAIITPLIWSFIRTPILIQTWLGLPRNIGSFWDMANNFIHIPINLFVYGPSNPTIWVGRVPILDIFTSAMVALGIYGYALRLRLEQAQLIGGILVIGSILIALGGPVNLFILLPWLYILAAAGLAYFWQEWLRVFPRNPVARGLGNSLIALAIVVACAYNLLNYFVAWPRTPATKEAFSYRLTDQP